MTSKYFLGQRDRQFVCYFHFVGWSCVSIGFHVDTASPNIEVHMPFGFIRVGWQGIYQYSERNPAIGWDRRRD